MSMQILTALQLIQVFCAYTLVVLVLPWMLLRKCLADRSMEERWTACFLMGNFYLMNLVFALQFLHISNRVTLLCGTWLPLAVWLYKNRKVERVSGAMRFCQKLLRGERRLKIELHGKPRRFLQRVKKKTGRWLCANGLELICFAVLCAALFYMYGWGVVTCYGYKASDVMVHNLWINWMDQNQMFHEGVYPHGFHAVIYYLEQVFGIQTFVLLRVFGFVETFYIHMALLLFLRRFCKNRYLPYLGLIPYILFKVFPLSMFERFAAPLPQEYGMLFLLPSGLFAIRFFQQQMEKRTCPEPERKAALEAAIRGDLFFFVLSFSLTITVHFYDTVLAGFLCVGIALGFWRQFIQWESFRRIMAAGLVSIVLAVIPMGIGLLEGHPMQGSMNWALGVIAGSSASDTASEDAAPVQQAPTFRERMKNVYTTVRYKVVFFAENEQEEARWDGVIRAIMALTLSGGGILLCFGVLEAVTADSGPKAKHAHTRHGPKRAAHYRNRESTGGSCERAALLLTIGWYDLFLLLLLAAPALGLPNLMDGDRAGIFLLYSQPLVWCMILEELFGVCRWEALRNAAAFLLVPGCVVGIIGAGALRKPAGTYVPQGGHVQAIFESNPEMICLTNIVRENQKFDWTICSANEERRMIEELGRHEELITFLRDLEKEQPVTLPTHYVYFFIEKIPINYYTPISEMTEGEYQKQVVSREGAARKLSTGTSLEPYRESNRWVTMSHIYYWAQAFQKLYPDAMDVYYEDDEFVCYRLEQNVDNLYNLTIDYGYNH